jgi:hypothetical protein
MRQRIQTGDNKKKEERRRRRRRRRRGGRKWKEPLGEKIPRQV